jgi:integrase
VRRVEFAGQCVLVPTKRREYRNFSVPLCSTQCETAETFTCHVKAVADLLGHSSISIMGDIYGHTSDATTRAPIDGLTSILGH